MFVICFTLIIMECSSIGSYLRLCPTVSMLIYVAIFFLSGTEHTFFLNCVSVTVRCGYLCSGDYFFVAQHSVLGMREVCG